MQDLSYLDQCMWNMFSNIVYARSLSSKKLIAVINDKNNIGNLLSLLQRTNGSPLSCTFPMPNFDQFSEMFSILELIFLISSLILRRVISRLMGYFSTLRTYSLMMSSAWKVASFTSWVTQSLISFTFWSFVVGFFEGLT